MVDQSDIQVGIEVLQFRQSGFETAAPDPEFGVIFFVFAEQRAVHGENA
jgi:hypothetical protein